MNIITVLFSAHQLSKFFKSESIATLHSLSRLAGVVIVYLILRILLFRLLDQLVGRLTSRQPRMQTIHGICKSILGYLLAFIFAVQALDAIGVEIMPFVEAAGVMGLAIGFGAQKLVKDVISGFFIIVDNVFAVGEIVSIAGITGEVVEMGMRITKIQDLSGRLYLMANGDIGTVTNLSRHPIIDYVEISVANTTELTLLNSVIQTVGESLVAQTEGHLHAAPQLQGISALTGTAMTARISVETDPHHLLQEQMQVREALKEGFLKSNIVLI